jgi:hypothetical protein
MRLFASIAAVLALAVFAAAAQPPSERRFEPAEVKADFAELYAKLAASHFDLFARRAKSEYDALFRATMAGFDRPMNATEIRVAFQKFMAFGRVAHSNIAFPSDAYGAYRDAGGRAMPLSIRIKDGRVFVVDNGGVAPVAAGDEIVALNSQPIADWLSRLGAHVSADNDYMLHTLIENRFAPLLWLELGAADRFKLTLRDARRGQREVEVSARTRADMRAAVATPSPALDLDWDARSFRMIGAVGYLRPGPFYNNDPNATNIWDVSQFRDFIASSFGKLLQVRARALVIDLRDNPGGDNSFSDLMVAWYATKPFRFCRDFRIKVSEAAIASNAKRVAAAPDDKDGISAKFAAAYARHRVGTVFSFEIPTVEPRAAARFRGKVYLLVNRRSYSNAVQVAALSQDYGFATILGEETSDLATTLGAMEQFALSRTGIEVGFPKAHIIRVSGDTWPRGVVPDVAIDAPVVEPASDPVLRQALAIAGQ